MFSEKHKFEIKIISLLSNFMTKKVYYFSLAA